MASRFCNIYDGESNFVDIDNHWAKIYIDFACSNGWIIGNEENKFNPNEHITREEVITIINRMLSRQGDKSFINRNKDKLRKYSDVDENRWSYLDIIEASNSRYYQNVDFKEIWTGIRK